MQMSSLEAIVMLVLGKQTLFFIRLSNGLIIANCEMQTHHHHHYHHNLKQVKVKHSKGVSRDLMTLIRSSIAEIFFRF